MTVAVIGEVLVDLAWRTGGAHSVPHPGGSPANVAVGLHRLGRPTTLMTCWGDEPPGELLGAHLDSIGVEVHRLRPHHHRPGLPGRRGGTGCDPHRRGVPGGGHYHRGHHDRFGQ
ncbi:PfkB family carbohydrate kinase [Streptomyces sp. NPDC005263]|uniref:PfkB family carbohydrate kinase n=1 Tax=Streptomyces sp. NPDC005263 TaxID=3364711 RepID=UPI0036CE456F